MMAEPSEDEMLAQAIAMSLEAAAAQASSELNRDTTDVSNHKNHPQNTPPPPTCKAAEIPDTNSKTSSERLGQISEEASELAQVILSREEPLRTQSGAELPPAILMREWHPNKECLDLVMGMGISENAARRALYNTGNDNAELATSWVFENIDNLELHTPFNPAPTLPMLSSQQGSPVVYHSFDDIIVTGSEQYKMIFVVNTGLKMGVGKTAAQVGHATLALYQLLQTQANWKEQCTKWGETGMTKIAVQGQSAHHLLELKHRAYELRLPNIIVHDAGKTQLEPGSLTVFAVFGKIADVNKVTGQLKLL